ncbi:MAG TPA: hypothetical protein VMY42_22290 [Thermoguttaceae bacterium]|nr:hypothetical protein [Thermoguttaceae bacterium]
MYEQNEFRATAAYLGSGETINVENLAILPNANEHRFVPEDQDYFRLVAGRTGTLDFHAYFRMFDPGLLPAGGDIDIEVLDEDGTVIAGTVATGFGTPDATPNARVRIPAVAGKTYYLHVFGADNLVVNGYDLTILNEAPPVPRDIELRDTPVGSNSDTGRSQFDNVTHDNTPTIYFRLDDGIFLHDLPGNPVDDVPPDEVIPVPFRGVNLAPGYRLAVFDEGSTPGQPATPPQTPLGYATATAEEGLYTFTTPSLQDGSHFITARVQMIDPSDPDNNPATNDHNTGYGSRSDALEIIVDTQVPPVFFGMAADPTDGLDPAHTDTGVGGIPATIVDRITSDTATGFWGVAEANSIVRVYVDQNGNGAVDAGDVLIGFTVALPEDGTNQFPNGQWKVTTNVDLNDPGAFAFDGLRRLLVTAEDVAGNVSAPQALNIFIDTQGPRIFDPDGAGVRNAVHITDNAATPQDERDFDLFDPKPSAGPTPLVHALTIHVQDLPNRIAGFLYEALAAMGVDGDPANDPGHYLIRGDHNGVIPISNVAVDNLPRTAGEPAKAAITLTFFGPLPDDRYTLTISDALVDPAGNALDGESNAVEPQELPQLPSGDGNPGGDYVARFTVDSRPEIGVLSGGSVYVDTNGNFAFDPQNNDSVNRDIAYVLGFTSDEVFVGNFQTPDVGAPPADGFDKLAAYGRVGTTFRWLVDSDNNGVPDVGAPNPGIPGISTIEPAAINGRPVAGRFDGNDANGDEVGLFTGTTWHFDTNHDFKVDLTLPSNLRGYPIVGDFDGDGYDDLGTWKDDVFYFDLAEGVLRGWDGVVDASIAFGFIGVRERPVAADIDQDGIDDIGLWVPDRSGGTPEETAEWYFLVSNDPSGSLRENGPATYSVNMLDHPFEPVPFGSDQFAQFGDEYGVPLVGNFDPPVTPPVGARIVGRHVFYNNSAWDNHTPNPDVADDNAIAIDKAALRLSDAASFANYTSYSRGINGIMIDIANLPAWVTLDADDFEFRIGNTQDSSSWIDAPDPTVVSVREGAGTDGSDRVTLTWADHAIRNQWLQVTALAAGLGLAEDDVFYFGNVVGEAGNSTTDTQVTTTDLLLARNNPRNFLNPAPIDFAYDFNRDQRVNATDVLLARNNQTSFANALEMLNLSVSEPPQAAATSPAAFDEQGLFEPAVEAAALPAEWFWLDDIEQPGRRNRPSQNSDRAAEVVDRLLATYGL